ncbi:MAG: lipoprotein signal peptidase [Muribaculaceae bacterium]
MKISKGMWALIIILLVIIADQALKIYIKTHFYWGESVRVLPFFELRFVQNPGMAFGWQLGSKLFLTMFRICAVALFGWYLLRLRKVKGVPAGYVICIALITAGAAGNIFDCMFYGEIFNNPYPPQAAHFVPWGEGYGTVFEGMVVDMLYFPLFSFVWPEWMPWVGGSTFSFFDPVFNIADAAISVGILALLFFYHRYIMVLSDSDIDKLNAPGDGDKTK